MTLLPTGRQYEIRHGRYAVAVTEVGATLRSIRIDGREVLQTFQPDGVPLHSQGKQLLPWPNRIADGAYTFAGTRQQLPVNEIDRNTALHGLNDGRAFELVSHTADSVTQRHTFYPERGWPGTLTATITHSVSDDGLRVEVSAVNDGTAPLPYGYGVHPYFAFDDLAEVTLGLPFDEELTVDPVRLLPIRIDAVSVDHDFRTPRRLGDVAFDTAFSSPSTPDWEIDLADGSHGVRVWGDSSTPWVQVFTTPERDAIAVEPMTCGPDAFNEGPTHDGMITLAPGAATTAAWGVRAL